MRTVLVLAVSAALALGGCASSQSYGSSQAGLSNDQRIVRENAERIDSQQHEQDTKGEGTALGAVLGGVLGCGLGLLIADNKGAGCALGAAAGVAVGAGTGYAAGSWVAGKQTDYASKEDYYRDVIASADTEIAENRRAAVAANRLADQHAARIAQLNADYAAKKTSASAYRKQYESMEADANAIDATVQQNRQRIEELDQVIGQANYGDPAVQALKQRRDQLATENAALEDAYNQMVTAMATAPSEVQS